MNKVYHFLSQTGRDVILRVGGFRAKPSNGIHIITGHMTHQTAPDMKYMERLMSLLSKEVRFIRIEEAVKMIENHEQPETATLWHKASVAGSETIRQTGRPCANSAMTLSTETGTLSIKLR